MCLRIRRKQWSRLFEIWIHWQNHFFDCGNYEVFKFPLAEIPRSCRYFLRSHSLHWNQLYFCDLPFLNLTLFEVVISLAEFPTALLNVKYVIACAWEFRLPYVLQRFVGTNFLTEVILFNNLRTQHPENIWSGTSLCAELVWFFHAATLPVTFFASASTAAEWQLAWHTIK